jgi:Zn-dependent protease
MSSYPPNPYEPRPPRRGGADYPQAGGSNYPSPQGYPQPPTRQDEQPGWGAPPPPPTPPRGYGDDGFGRPGPPRQGGGRRRGGVWGGIVAALLAIVYYGKYVLLLGLKIPALATLVTLFVSFGLYAVFFGPWAAAGIVVMILIHEMGHVVEIRRQGMKATAPLFIPFFGAAIFQRQHANSALHQAQIGIAGPIAGTVAATVAFVLYSVTGQPVVLYWAYLGFFINLFNMIPIGMLDGGWVLAVASKWFQVLGIVALAGAAIFLGFSPFLFIIVILSIPTIIARFRNDSLPYYQAVPVPARWAMGALWLALTAYLAFAMYETHNALSGIVGGGGF